MLKTKKSTANKSMHNLRFDIVCTMLFPEMSRKKIKSIIDNGGAFLNKKRIKMAKIFVMQNDLVELFWNEAEKSLQVLKKENFIFECDDFIILNKPAGIPVQGTLESDKNTILHAIHKYDPKQYTLDKLLLVHRLDKDTSGLMIIAKNPPAQKEFEQLFKNQKIQKTYKALCFFTPKKHEGTIDYPIAPDISRKNTYFAVTTDKKYPNQKSAQTDYIVEKKLPHGAALIACHPKTGRTHQVRVHLLAINCPIVGDKTYAQNIYGHPYARSATRHLLHAFELKFAFKGTDYKFECPLPEDFNI